MSIPLEELQLQEEVNGKIRTIQALDRARVTHIQFVSYTPPPTDLSDTGQVEEWGNRIGFIAEDLHKLLQLKHDKFWCQAIHDETLQTLIDTYLKNAPRSYDVLCELPEDFQELHDEVHKLIFKTCLRLATHKEDKEHFISPGVFGEIIYENFLFDIPKIFDICVLFGKGNEALLSKMINNIFTQQPKYNEDLSCVIPTIFQAFEDMKRKCCMLETSRERGKIPLDVQNGKTGQTMENLSLKDLQDLIFYIADIGVTVSSFLEVYPTAPEIFQQANFICRLSESYDIVPALLAEVKRRDFDDYGGKQLLKVKLAHAKKDLMKIVHLIITKCFIEPILENGDAPEEFVEGFISTLSAVLHERQFLADFEGCHPFQYYSDILAQCSYEIDEARIQYIQDAFSSAFATYGKRRKPYGATTRGGRTSPDGSPGPVEEDMGAEAGCDRNMFVKDEDDGMAGACAPTKKGVELDSMIAAVKDLLPELGEGFVEVSDVAHGPLVTLSCTFMYVDSSDNYDDVRRKSLLLCLEETGYDIEKVINFVLEDKLPQSLQNIDRNLPRKKLPVIQDSISQRTNVFDNDEFDVFSNDQVDLSRIHRGKREKEEIQDVDDKDMANIKSTLAQKYGYETVYAEVDDEDDEVYNDEYDDTYDTINVGADDADSADELSQRRQFRMPRVLEQKQQGKEKGSSGESSEESDQEAPVRDEFIQNPALIRQRAEERAQWKDQRRRKNPQTGGQEQDKKHDVKGAPKGKGQSGEVLKNRAWKEKHKSSRANHNRKYYSDKKRMA